jgi:xenotropic and polytropic retrovirus receptor 1
MGARNGWGQRDRSQSPSWQTSLVKPAIDLAYSMCYILSFEWNLGYSKQGACHQSPIFANVVTPVICALPLWCRFMQCLRVYHDTQRRFPALPNALKYAVSLLVVLFGALHPQVVASFSAETAWIQVAWLLSYLGNTFYTFFWDVYMDWRLGRRVHNGLRERLMFRRREFYYWAIGLDFCLRFGWTATVIPHNEVASAFSWFQFQAQWLIPAVSTAEACRRAMWAVLRLEAEHLHNTEGFRRVDVIPLHFDHKEKADAEEEPAAERRSHVLLELFIYGAIVTLLAAASDIYRDRAPNQSQGSKPHSIEGGT